ncbi:calcium-binding protein, partial [Rubellimicrobium roseum]|uniref:calcium-binding protein n=1 Tax=Rubellimicrobium roseum TaxID=687525 RepID=UPI0024824401
DLLQGRGGFDILDGDAWLNVRIKIVKNGVTYSAESLNSSTIAGGPFAGKVLQTDGQGNPRFDLPPAFDGRSLQSLLLDRTIKPSDMSIVRELKFDSAVGDVDTALFQGSGFEYIIEGRGFEVVDGDITEIKSAWDVNEDGFISVTDTLTNRAGLIDDTDLLKNIERLQFADEIIDITQNLGVILDTRILFDPARLIPLPTALPSAGVVGTILADVAGGTFSESADPSDIFTVAEDGTVTLARAMAINQNYNLFLELAARGGIQNETLRFWTGSSAAQTMGSSADDDIIYALAGNDILNGGDGQDRLYGQAGNDNISGGNNADIIAGGTGSDIIDAGAGADIINFVTNEGTDTVEGGADTDTLRVFGTTAANTISVTLGATGILALTGISRISGVESIVMDLDDGADRLAYGTTTLEVAVDLTMGLATGFRNIANIEHVTGGNGSDNIQGNTLANSLLGGGGADTIVATVDDVRDVYTGGAGVDTVDFSAYT